MSTKNKITERLIVSFIGNTDLKFFPPQGEDCSPILRLMLGMKVIEPRIPTVKTRLLLFDDDKPGQTKREEFCNALERIIPECGFAGVTIERYKLSLAEGPTDLHALYEQVWRAIPAAKGLPKTEVLFHISSGVPAMGFTLLLAANCLPLDHVRIFETSAEKDVKEVRLPYVLAAREARYQQRAARRIRLPEKARKTLIEHTVIDDPHVNESYAVLYKCATESRDLPVRLIIKGPAGSGKWHACQQFDKWRGSSSAEWIKPDLQPAIPADCTLCIHDLNGWSEDALRQLTQLSATRPDIAIVATYRTDQPPAAPIETLARDGLRGAVQIELPSLGARNDIASLGIALANQSGIRDGKLHARLHYDWQTDLYPNNLHDLRRLLINAAAYSDGMHPENDAYRRMRGQIEAEHLLSEAWNVLSGLAFGQGQSSLDELLDQVRYATLSRLVNQGRSQAEVAMLTGMKQTTVSDALKKKPHSLWRTGKNE